MRRYKIKSWHLFETAKTKNVAVKSYGTYPLKSTGMGYSRLKARTDFFEVYGAFRLLVTRCHQQSECERDGWLTEDGKPTGRPLDVDDLVHGIGGTTEQWTHVLEVLSDPDLRIEWLLIQEDEQAPAQPVPAGPEPSGSRGVQPSQVGPSPEAEAILAAHPLQYGEAKSLAAIDEALANGTDADHLLERTQAYAEAVSKWPDGEQQYIKRSQSWFEGRHWNDDPSTWVRKAKPLTWRDEGFDSAGERRSMLNSWATKYAVSKKAGDNKWTTILANAQEKWGDKFAEDMVARSEKVKV